ncbi:MAG: 16S rRNA (uracil(1498)-N(3))-methyltransferase [wastewater metagenome]|nr:16S rRNA (uracil(1498)-N(3))-methyltransferase [Candidatus Loosdrechtia aerotolerans]
MHQNRFYIPEAPATREIWIEGREAHHILHVKRAKPGSEIILFDGKGIEYLARVAEITDSKLKVSIEQSKDIDREPNINITIAFSIPKGKLVGFLIQKCVELGVKTLIPVHCERSVVNIRDRHDMKLERWNRIVVEASKQCKRNSITKVEKVIPLNALIKTASNYDLSLIASTELNARTLKSVLGEHPLIKKIICLVGPEGGFVRHEIEIAIEAGFIPVSIGDSTLRIETAAIAISSMFLYAYSG